MAQGNRDACQRIFANMLTNAGRYAHSYLDIRMQESCGQVQLLFENDSAEIRENDVPNLFNRFYRNDVSRSKGGTGLGLTIAKSLAEAMGGSLTAQALPEASPRGGEADRDGGGTLTTILFTLTLAAVAAPPLCPRPGTGGPDVP